MKTVEQLCEVWKDIPGYEGLYQVSNLGNVRSLGRYVTVERDKKVCSKRKASTYVFYYPGKLLTPIETLDGYLTVALSVNRLVKIVKIHRLVALAFIPNPHNLPVINHKDENKKNNSVYVNEDGTVNEPKSNLEWCTVKYNANYGTRNTRTSRSKSKKIAQYDLKGNHIATFESIREASMYVGVCYASISSCLRGIYKTAGNFVWRYTQD